MPNKVSYDNQLSERPYGSLTNGTVFHYPAGTVLYIKTDTANTTVSLSNGASYDIANNKLVVPLPQGTIVTLDVNA
jgi:hypothetical protein